MMQSPLALRLVSAQRASARRSARVPSSAIAVAGNTPPICQSAVAFSKRGSGTSAGLATGASLSAFHAIGSAGLMIGRASSWTGSGGSGAASSPGSGRIGSSTTMASSVGPPNGSSGRSASWCSRAAWSSTIGSGANGSSMTTTPAPLPFADVGSGGSGSAHAGGGGANGSGGRGLGASGSSADGGANGSRIPAAVACGSTGPANGSDAGGIGAPVIGISFGALGGANGLAVAAGSTTAVTTSGVSGGAHAGGGAATPGGGAAHPISAGATPSSGAGAAKSTGTGRSAAKGSTGPGPAKNCSIAGESAPPFKMAYGSSCDTSRIGLGSDRGGRIIDRSRTASSCDMPASCMSRVSIDSGVPPSASASAARSGWRSGIGPPGGIWRSSAIIDRYSRSMSSGSLGLRSRRTVSPTPMVDRSGEMCSGSRRGRRSDTSTPHDPARHHRSLSGTSARPRS